MKGEPGDFVIKIIVENDKNFRRDGYDIYSILPVSLSDALLGIEVEVKTLYGESQYVQIESGTTHKQIITLPGKGIFNSARQQYGNHHLKVYLEMPDKVTKEMEDIVKECFQ